MAEIDPIVEPLLTGLLNSPMADYGRAATVRLEENEGFRDEGFDLRAGRRAAQRQRRRMRAERQIKAIDAVVQNALTRELALTDRLQGLAERLKIRSIGVLPAGTGEATAEAVSSPGPIDELLNSARATAIKTFLEVWADAVRETRQRLEHEL
ncbi:hypothetical protein [Methylorubrum salsuginis]|nr:hypothetical protein [Methylorubrum salsuginis]